MLLKNCPEDVCTYIKKNKETYVPVGPELVQTSTFCYDDYQNFMDQSKDENNNYIYTRGANPTTSYLEDMLSDLIGCQKCKVFSSGMGAIAATLLTLLKQGDHMIMLNTIYGEAYSFAKYINKFGIDLTKVYIEKPEEVVQYIQDNTKIIYLESPSHQKCQMLDLEGIVQIARAHGITTVMDATWASPLFMKPFTYGIDLVIHSMTKYIAGHSDSLGGVVCGDTDIIDTISEYGLRFLGSVSSPFNSWLTIRGLRTLPVRMSYLSNAIVQFIDAIRDDPRIAKIYHPYAATGYQQELSKKYLSGYGSLFSLELADEDFDKLTAFVDKLSHFSIGVSWGGFESLVLPSFKGDNQAKLDERGLRKSHMRMYIGLENTQTLIDDFIQALDSVY